MLKKHIRFLLSILFLLSGCTPCRILSVRSAYITEEMLASTHVGTPDPRRGCPQAGQQLIISWNLPKKCAEAKLEITMRFRNQEEKQESVLLQKQRGTFVYEMLNEEYAKTGGILTYKIEVKEGDQVIEQWVHPLWTERLKF